MADPKTQTKDPESPPEKRIRRDLPNHQQSPWGNLPDDVIENVFSFLPLKEAIAVGCNVSTKFKSSWRINRQFAFGKDFALRYSREDLIALVGHLFDSHRGTDIQTFHLHVDPIGIENLILKWLSICIQKNVEYLEFHFFQDGFIIDSDFVSKLKKLSTLKLVRCEFQLPPLFSGLRLLQTLILWQMEMTEEKLECLVMNCKLLVNLDLFNCSRIRLVNIFARHHLHFKTLKIASCPDLFGIQIDAPTVKSFFYAGHTPRIRFGHGVTLDEAFFNFTPTRTYMLASEVEFLTNDLHHVRVLTTSALFIEALSARIRGGWVYKEAQFRLLHLRELQLFMEGGSYCNPYDIVMFLKNCPSLESLFIDLNDYHFECGMYWEMHQKPMLNKFNHYFNRLRVVKLKGFKFLQSELGLVKILLQKATSLESLVFITPRNGRINLHYSDAPKYNHLFHSWKASPKVKISLLEHTNDTSGRRPSHPKYWY